MRTVCPEHIECTVILAIFGPNDLYGPVRNAFDAGKSITRARGRGLGPVKWHRAVRRVSFGVQKSPLAFFVL
jgi:hypothetical protein